MALTFDQFKEKIALAKEAGPAKEPRVDTIPLLSDEESEELGRELGAHPLPFRYHRGRS